MMREFMTIVEDASDPIKEFEAWKAETGVTAMVTLKRGYLEPNDLYIDGIHVPAHQKGSGAGRMILAKLIEIADAHHIPLTLEASEESEDADWIQGWYQRHGFDYSDDGYGDYGPYMVRAAR